MLDGFAPVQAKYEPLIQHNCADYRASITRRISIVKLFDDFASLEDLAG